MDLVLNSVLKNKNHFLKQQYITRSNNVIEFQSFEPILSEIKTLLLSNSDQSKNEGILLILSFFPRFSNQIISENCLLWFQNCLKLFGEKNSKQLIVKLSEKKEIFEKKDFSQTIVQQFLQILFKNDLDLNLLKLLNVFLEKFPQSFAEKNLENFLLKFISDSNQLLRLSEEMIDFLALNFSKLNIFGEKEEKELFSKTLFTFQSILKSDLKREKFEVLFETKAENDLILNEIIVEKRVRFLSRLLIGQLTTNRNARPVCLPIRALFELIVDLLNTFRIETNSFVSQNVNCLAFDLIEALVVSSNSEIVIFSKLLNKIFLDSLQNSKFVFHQNLRPFSRFRSKVYAIFEKYLIICGFCCALSENQLKDILQNHILFDLKPNESIVKIKNAKKFRKSEHLLNNSLIDCEICCKALKVFQHLVIIFGQHLDSISFLYKQIVEILLNIYKENDFEKLYSEKCRKNLLKVLFLMQRNSQTFDSTLISIVFLAKKLDQKSVCIQRICSEMVLKNSFLRKIEKKEENERLFDEKIVEKETQEEEEVEAVVITEDAEEVNPEIVDKDGDELLSILQDFHE